MSRFVRIAALAATVAGCASPAAAQMKVSEVFVRPLIPGYNSAWDKGYVELLNAGAAPIDLSGWRLRYWSLYAPATVVPLSGTLPAGGRFLIAFGTQTIPNIFTMPTPDLVSPVEIQWGHSFAVVDPGGAIQDVVGVDGEGFLPLVETRAARVYSPAHSIIRRLGGCYDTDDGFYDFKDAYGDPQNSSAPAVPCGPPPPCNFVLSPTAMTLPGALPHGQVTITAAEHCRWTVQGPDWLTFDWPEGIGDRQVLYHAQPIDGTRTGTITIGNATQTVTQLPVPPCTFTLNPPTSQHFAGNGGFGSVYIGTELHCRVMAEASDPWITITAGASFNGPASIQFNVAPLASGARTGTITAGTAVYTITQSGLDADADDDGLDDSWEVRFGLDPTIGGGINGPLGDPDTDGVTNVEEQARGSHPYGIFKRYFAEGVTNAFFETSFALFAPDRATTVAVTYMKENGETVSEMIDMPARTRRTVSAGNVTALHGASFATVVESDEPIVADRTLVWGRGGYGAHAETGLQSPSTRWYLAEGSTSGDFSLFYLLQNPGAQATTVSIRYLRPNGLPPIVKTYEVLPFSRRTIAVDSEDALLATTDVSAVIDSLYPIVVERAMYLSRPGQPFAAGHESAGVRDPWNTWLLAEGATGDFFDTFILIVNPNPETVTLRVEYLLSTGGWFEKFYTVAGQSRLTIWVDDEHVAGVVGPSPLANATLSTRIVASRPVVVERTMWWPGPQVSADYWYESHNSPGQAFAARRWALAEGIVGTAANWDTYVLIANPSNAAASVRVTVLPEQGEPIERTFEVPASRRFTIPMGSAFGLTHARFATLVESQGVSAPEIVVERAMYSSAAGIVWSAGTNALATYLP